MYVCMYICCFAKLMYTEYTQAQALPTCHANANISVPLVM